MPNREIREQNRKTYTHKDSVTGTVSRRTEGVTRRPDGYGAKPKRAEADRPKVKIAESSTASGIEKLTKPNANLERQMKDLGI